MSTNGLTMIRSGYSGKASYARQRKPTSVAIMAAAACISRRSTNKGGDMKPFTCPTCKMDIVFETMHGWVRDRKFGIETGWKQRIIACPTCSEQANARHMAENIARLMGSAH